MDVKKEDEPDGNRRRPELERLQTWNWMTTARWQSKMRTLDLSIQQMADPSIDWLHQLSTQRIVNDNELISRVPPVGLFQLNGSLISYLLKDSWQVNARYRARHGRSRGGPAWLNLTLLNINGISPLRMIRIFGLKIDKKWNAMNEVNLSVGDHFNRKKTNPAVSRSDVWNSVRYPPHFYSRDY